MFFSWMLPGCLIPERFLPTESSSHAEFRARFSGNFSPCRREKVPELGARARS
jgi:hypothetical protein